MSDSHCSICGIVEGQGEVFYQCPECGALFCEYCVPLNIYNELYCPACDYEGTFDERKDN
jgi:hypothetical protein